MYRVVLCNAEFAILGVFCILQLDIYRDVSSDENRYIVIASLSWPMSCESYCTVSYSVHRFYFRISFS